MCCKLRYIGMLLLSLVFGVLAAILFPVWLLACVLGGVLVFLGVFMIGGFK